MDLEKTLDVIADALLESCDGDPDCAVKKMFQILAEKKDIYYLLLMASIEVWKKRVKEYNIHPPRRRKSRG